MVFIDINMNIWEYLFIVLKFGSNLNMLVDYLNK